MPETRARNFIERLPAIIEREEEDISHLDPEMIEILYPARASREFTLTVVFGSPPPSNDGDPGERERNYERAVSIAERARGYRKEGKGRYLRHFATFGIDEVTALYNLYAIVSDFPSCEILVKGKRVPYARELWLPLFWFFKKDED